jgi:hypothetical protein
MSRAIRTCAFALWLTKEKMHKFILTVATVGCLAMVGPVLAQKAQHEPGDLEVTAYWEWSHCADHAVDRLYTQPGPADTIAKAAMAACATEKRKYMQAAGTRNSALVENQLLPGLVERVNTLSGSHSRMSLRHN